MKKVREEANASGDTKKVEEINAHGGWVQKQMNFQAFGHAPVGDLLAHIKEKLLDVARKARVDVVAWEYDYAADSVEVVDVTDLLLKQFDPSPKTLKTIVELRKTEPVPLEKLKPVDQK